MKKVWEEILLVFVVLSLGSVPFLIGAKRGTEFPHYSTEENLLECGEFQDDPYENGWYPDMYSEFAWNPGNENCEYVEDTEEEKTSSGLGRVPETFYLGYEYEVGELVEEWDYMFFYKLKFSWNQDQFWFAKLGGILGEFYDYTMTELEEEQQPYTMDVMRCFEGGDASSTDTCYFKITVTEPQTGASAFDEGGFAVGVTDDHVVTIEVNAETPGTFKSYVENLIN